MTTKRFTAANSFPLREVNALLELHACVLRGGDARHMAQSTIVCNVMRKFRVMQRRYAEAKAQGVDISSDNGETVS